MAVSARSGRAWRVNWLPPLPPRWWWRPPRPPAAAVAAPGVRTRRGGGRTRRPPTPRVGHVACRRVGGRRSGGGGRAQIRAPRHCRGGRAHGRRRGSGPGSRAARPRPARARRPRGGHAARDGDEGSPARHVEAVIHGHEAAVSDRSARVLRARSRVPLWAARQAKHARTVERITKRRRSTRSLTASSCADPLANKKQTLVIGTSPSTNMGWARSRVGN